MVAPVSHRCSGEVRGAAVETGGSSVSGDANPLKRCPSCGGYDPFDPRTPEEGPNCTPITCSAWKFTARLTKQGPKPVRPDGRAALSVVSEESR